MANKPTGAQESACYFLFFSKVGQFLINARTLRILSKEISCCLCADSASRRVNSGVTYRLPWSTLSMDLESQMSNVNAAVRKTVELF